MNYYYLMASLPMLSLDQELMTSSTQFLSLCRDTLSEELYEQLDSVSLVPGVPSCCQIDTRWQAYETVLRNCVAHQVAHKTKTDPIPYLKDEVDAFVGLEKEVEAAFDDSNPMQTEKRLDSMRLSVLDDLVTGHEFDFEALFVYRVKLLIVEKWNSLTKVLGQEKVDKTVAQILANSQSVEASV
jgi:hypothetical protein